MITVSICMALLPLMSKKFVTYQTAWQYIPEATIIVFTAMRTSSLRGVVSVKPVVSFM
jgi:hypothetical protein